MSRTILVISRQATANGAGDAEGGQHMASGIPIVLLWDLGAIKSLHGAAIFSRDKGDSHEALIGDNTR